MEYPHLYAILEEEAAEIRRIEKRWQPKSLLFIPQARALLLDLERRYGHLEDARDEMMSLDRGAQYISYLGRMRVSLRQALIYWKGDQLTFLRAVTNFYSDYGAVLRLLRQDSMRGLLPPTTVSPL